MHINISQLKGNYVYLELLRPEHVPALRALARDERIWQYTKTLLVNETFDQ